jgi:hypothetical protein
MPRVDPEARREYRRQYYLANRERIKIARKAAYQADPESARAYTRAWYAANRDRHSETVARWAAANPDKIDAAMRRYRKTQKFRDAVSARRHGPNIAEDFAAMWSAQAGCCYLCDIPLTPAKARIDHDHRCCPVTRSCHLCRRGLACNRCNQLIGQVADDPALLRRIADNLERVLGPTRERIAAKPRQGALI